MACGLEFNPLYDCPFNWPSPGEDGLVRYMSEMAMLRQLSIRVVPRSSPTVLDSFDSSLEVALLVRRAFQ